ncbi:MAG TPA: TonB-dependent receptor [Pyrinomonadaceae bacterium]|nr:TonB-dependent receptor [Pyrinomonadaceae bacterium]
MLRRGFIVSLIVALFLSVAVADARAQATGTIRGKISLADNDRPLHNVIVTVVELRRSTQTDVEGVFELTQVPPGNYTVLAHMEGFPDATQRVTVAAGATVMADFQLRITGLREEITVTATGTEQTVFQAFQSVTTLDTLRLAEESHPSIGEVLEKEPGVAKRSFGPGSSRPVIRGFDGDRVLVLQDGARTGSLSSQSGDHGEPVDVLQLERLEVLKGPATLLYGSNAIGGVVNAVTGHDYAHEGTRGYFTALGGTTNNQAGVSGGVEYGTGKFMFWGSGTGQRTGDYDTPLGRIPNSKTRVASGTGGFGYYADKGFFSTSYTHDNRRYGVPFAGLFEAHDDEDDEDEAKAAVVRPAQLDGDDVAQIDLAMRRHDLRFNGGFRNTGRFIDSFTLKLNYSDYQHRELEGEEVGTVFSNKQFLYRGVFNQLKRGRLTGSFGFSGFLRDYEAVGAETLAPPVDQNSFAVFTLQELDFERVRFQLGGRVERNGYEPLGLPSRSFTGFSGAAGVRFTLWPAGALVFNYTHSYRAPALEELYNRGPHIGNLTFEIGNPDLKPERSDGLELSLRHSTGRVRAEANFFHYSLRDFVFLAPTGDLHDGLIEAEYLQADSRFVGAELSAEIGLREDFFLNLNFDTVDAELKDTGTPLPRIPPMRGRVGFDWRRGGFSLRPEAVFVKDKNEIFTTETRTAGYSLFNMLASYTLARTHYAHIFSVNAFNLGDRVYRNHLSFIKDLAPEIGRGVRFTYTVRVF